MGAVSQESKEFLYRQNWDEVIPKAILYAARRLERYEWQGSRKGRPPMGQTAQDFVNDVIISLLEGRRIWDPEKHPNLLPVICGMVKSEISNCLNSAENKKTLCEKALPSSEWVNNPLESFPHPSEATDSSLLSDEKEAEDNKWLMAFMGHIEDDSELMNILDCKLKGIFKPAEIARELGIDEQRMENLQKKWKRRVGEFQKKNKINQESRKGGTVHG